MSGRRKEPGVEVSGAGAVGAAGSIRDVRTHVGDVYGVEALPLRVAALDYSGVLAQVPVERFCGRQWLCQRVEEELSDGAGPGGRGRYVLIGARAGLGKTAFAAWLSHEWDCVRHFTHQAVAGGRETRVALQSLAAQLVIRYGLDEFAPGGMLAGWVGDPARFAMVLAAAAEQAGRDGERVRIVIDGLEEAVGGGPALGLPGVLPAGVDVVATYREGVAPGRLPSGDGVCMLRIEADDPAHLNDIRHFLSVELRSETVAAGLAGAGVSVADAVSTLVQRSGGVWVYLRYVLSQMRSGSWRVEDLNELPSGLVGYYRHHVTGRRGDPSFHDQDLAVLAMLAVAAQPVTREQIVRLTGLAPSAVRGMCDFRYRPFLAVYAEGPDEEPRYSLFHASLRDFLHGQADLSAGESELVEINDLRRAVRTAHDRVADHYLAVLGGLGESLPVLRADAGVADIDDRYCVRHLPEHLRLAGRHEELRALLACRLPGPGGRLGSVWADVHDRLGTLDDYVSQIEMARRTAEDETDRQLAAGLPAPGMSTEFLCALLTVAVRIRSRAIPAHLLEALARAGAWDAGRALAHARRIERPVERIRVMTDLIPHITDPRQAADVREELLSAASAAGGEEQRASMLKTISAVLDPADLARALQATALVGDDRSRAFALTRISRYVKHPLDHRTLERVRAAAQRIEDAELRAQTLITLELYLRDSTFLKPAMHATQAITDGVARAWAAVSLAKRLKGAERARLVDQVLDTVEAAADEQAKASLLTELLWVMNPAQLDRALGIAHVIADGGARAMALFRLAWGIEGAGEAAVVDQALDAVQTVRDGKSQARALSPAGNLNQVQRERVLRMAQMISDDEARATAVARLIPASDEPAAADFTQRALVVVQDIADERKRALALNLVTNKLRDPASLKSILGIARTIRDRATRARTLGVIAGRFEGPARVRIHDEALASALSIDDNQRAFVLADLVRTLEGSARERALHHALAAVGPMTGWPFIYGSLIRSADELDEPHRTMVLDRALDAAFADAWRRHGFERRLTVRNLLSHIRDPTHFTRVLEAAFASGDDGILSLSVVAMIGHTNGPAQLKRVVEAVWGIDNEALRARTLISIAEQVETGGVRPAGYPRVVYFCANTNVGFTSPAILGRVCFRSLDGGTTWTRASQLFASLLPKHAECGTSGESFSAVDGYYPEPASDGSLYVLVACGGKTYLARSNDEEATFPVVHTAGGPVVLPADVPIDSITRALGSGPQLRIGTDDVFYLVYPQLTGSAITKLVVRASGDHGVTWSGPSDLTAPGVTRVLRWSAAQRGDGLLAVGYLGQRAGQTTWDAYVTTNTRRPRRAGPGRRRPVVLER